MVAGRADLTIQQGETFSRTIILSASNGESLDLTGYGLKLQIRSEYGDASALVTLSSPSSGLSLSEGPVTVGSQIYTSGIVLLQIDSAVTATLSTVKENNLLGYYDLFINKDGIYTKVLNGLVYLSPKVTAW